MQSWAPRKCQLIYPGIIGLRVGLVNWVERIWESGLISTVLCISVGPRPNGLETRLIIKILTHPCYPRNFDCFYAQDCIIFGQHKTDVKLFLESYQQFYFSFICRKMSEFTRRSGGSIIYGVFSFCVRFLPRIYQRSDQSTNSGATVGTGHRLSIYRQIYLYLQNW